MNWPTIRHVRWMIARDMPEVLAIEAASFLCSWTNEDLGRFLRQRNAIGMVLEHRETVVGYMLYLLHTHKLNLANLAVHPDWRRQRVGLTMLEKLTAKLSQRRTRIECEVRETNLPAQLFLRACGFRAQRVLRGWYDDTDEDAYRFEYAVELVESVKQQERV